ncbi:Sorting nexin-13 [Geodia barretti]|uniref:Sorting nexin-13 n=1 Tax=Geodia barretti TaxID=519541 RepID=A0AA35TZQ8_GEOBA|nr:Sorting nexin-13 [Geodia barretti]
MIQFILLLCCVTTLLGFVSVVWLLSWYQAGRLLLTIGGEKQAAPPQWFSTGCPQARTLMCKPRPSTEPGHVLTGREVIDTHLRQGLQYGMRDFVQSWFHVWVSPNPAFPGEVQRAVVTVVTELTRRCSEADLATLLSQTLLEESLTHLSRCKEASGATGCADTETESLGSRVLAGLPNDDPWTAVCLQPEIQRAYFQGASELLLFLILPDDEFSSPPLRLLLRDLMTQQIWIPLLQALSAPDFINTTLISLCKEQSLNSESFLAAVRTPHSPAEVERLQEFVAVETERLKTRGVSGADQQRLASLDVVMTTIVKQLQGETEEGAEEVESSLPLSLSVSLPEYMIERGNQVKYTLSVQCHHSGLDVTETWSTRRQFSDFHDFHMTLRNTLGSLPPSLSLPSRRAIKKLDRAFLDSRRRGLESYLQTLVSETFLSRYPHALPLVSLFISDETYRRSSNEINRQVDRLLHPFRKSPPLSKLTNTLNKVTSSPMLPQRQRLASPDSASSEEEEQELDLLLKLLDELFDLRDHGQWLRRQVAHILSQLLGDRVSRKVAEGVAWLTSPDQVSQNCRDLINTIWPGGVRPHHGNREGEELGEEEEEEGGVERVKMLRSVLVRSKLIGTVPDDLRRLLGSRRTTQGMARLSHLLQDKALNSWLCLRLFEAILQTLFPSHSLSPALRSLRQQLHNTGGTTRWLP